MAHTRTILSTENAATPALSLLFGYGAMAPLVVGTILAWVLPLPAGLLARNLTVVWGCAILLFLSGVRRGLSFRTPDGPRLAQLATMLWLFALGFIATVFAAAPLGPLLLAAGYASVAVLDPVAARRGEAPLFFARLRPVQMAIPVICMLALLPW